MGAGSTRRPAAAGRLGRVGDLEPAMNLIAAR